MFQTLKVLVRMTATQPRRAAGALLTHTPPFSLSLELAILVVALGAILTFLLTPFSSVPGMAFVYVLLSNPILLAFVQMITLLVTVVVVFAAGRIFGGKGDLNQSLAITVWLQFIMLLLQIVLVPVLVLSAPLAQALTALANIFAVWVFVNFVAELHGFSSLLKVFAGMIATAFATSFLIIFLLAMIGMGAMGA
ncbi:MAG: YIP1 family protein [Alphaproteobacteria bacterium]|nr:YIP1 family protein [Alphaproteobacteria bacterium]